MRPIEDRGRRVGALVLVGLAAVAVALALSDTATPRLPEGERPARAAPLQGPIVSIDLPASEPPPLPPGPNREQFVAACRLCHSPQFALTQPRLTAKKWAEVVHKMVVVYGAPLPQDQEPAIVAYLSAVHGRKP